MLGLRICFTQCASKDKLQKKFAQILYKILVIKCLLGVIQFHVTILFQYQDINDNAPRFLKNYSPVLPEHSPPRKVVEVLATDDDDRSKGNGPSFTFRMDPNAHDNIRASFKVEHDPSKRLRCYYKHSICI